ncbi:hypothetical protein PVAP13_6KG334806 [Panicum virgatum]|uniref:Uncharacterized protein n=1 Tax=Panicum virgatum TaxID=38727 RepID=A0A8T0RGW9_PANVG|nr:hypothetical protein PVAP13_6KG334806 [Panicum virgatum]
MNTKKKPIFFYLRCAAQVTHPTGRALGILNSARGHGLILRGDRDALGSPVSPTGRGDGRAPAIVAAGAGGSRRYGQEPSAHAAGFASWRPQAIRLQLRLVRLDKSCAAGSLSGFQQSFRRGMGGALSRSAGFPCPDNISLARRHRYATLILY